jgi:hypothetical protein
LSKAYKDTLSYLNIVDHTPTSEFGLEDELCSDLDDLEAYRSVIAKGERVLGSYPPLLYDTNSVNKE